MTWFRAGERYGRECEARSVEYVRESLAKAERKIQKYRDWMDAQKRDFGRPGAQLVTIDRRLAYRWRGADPLKVGDKVWLPGMWFSPGEWIGEVTELGSTYDGAHVDVLRRAT